MKRCKQWVAAILALICLAAPTVSALSGEPGGEYIRYEVLSAADLLSLMDGVTVGDAERAFLERYHDTEVTYNGAIPGELITLSGAGNYTTKTPDGTEILWVASGSVVLDGTAGLATATYKGTLSLSAAEANGLRNYAWEEAVSAASAQTAIDTYNTGEAAYQNYLALLAAYETRQAAYESYVTEKQAYDQALAKYQANQKLWDDYNAAMVTYNAAKEAYDTAKATYDTEKAAYDAKLSAYNQQMSVYSSNMTAYEQNTVKIDQVMLPMEQMFVPYGDRNGSTVGSLYQALQNKELVQTLLDYETAICSATSLTSKDFDKLKDSADDLNELLQQYAAKREISQKEAFVFYQANYAEIRDTFNYLYDSMSAILKPSVYSLMCAAVDEEYGETAEYKKWRIKNVLCQIYLISQCLDDTSTATANWSFYADNGDPHTYYYNQLIGRDQYITDTNKFSPLSISWIDRPTEPTHPGEVPVEPVVPILPTKPLETVKEPTAPTVVAKPEKPTAVTQPQKPAQSVYDQVARCADLLVAKQNGTLTRRAEVSAKVTLTLTQTVSRRYDGATGSFLESVYDEKGNLSSRDKVAASWEEAGGKYVLLGFRTSADGLCVYPIYERQDRVFTVTFQSGDQVVARVDYAYGQVPTPPADPQKPMTETTVYEFEAWVPPLAAVKEDTVYEATFSQQERLYTVTFQMKDKTEVQTLPYQATPTPPTPTARILEGIYLYRFMRWDQTVAPVTGDITYTAIYTKTALVEVTPTDPPAETEPEETSPSESTPGETAPVPSDTAPAQTEAAGSTPAESGPSEPVTTDTSSVGSEPAVTAPSETTPGESSPAETDPSGNGPAETDPAVTAPSQTVPAESDPSGEDTEADQTEPPKEPEGYVDLTQDEDGFVVSTNQLSLQIGSLLELCYETDTGLKVQWDDTGSRLIFSRDAIASLQEQGVIKMNYLTGSTGVTVGFYDAENRRVFPAGTVRMYLPAEEDEGKMVLRRYDKDGNAEDLTGVVPVDGMYLIDLDGETTYRVVRSYRLTLAVQGEGSVTPGELWLEEGETISLNLYPKTGHRVAKLTLSKADGTGAVDHAESDVLTMPSYNGLLTVVFEEIRYTIEFRYRGGSVVQTYAHGEQVKAPEIETFVIEGDVYYSFIGWSKNIEIATEDTVYEARYEVTTPEAGNDPGVGDGAMSGVLRYWILPAAVIGLASAGVITVGVILLVKLKKKRKNPTKRTKKEQ